MLKDLFAQNVLVRWLRGDSAQYDLIVSMVGVRLGERLLVAGGGDGRLVAALGRKTGLTGRICAVERDQATADAVFDLATKEGVLSDVEVSPLEQLPFEHGAFDVAVLPALADGLPRPTPTMFNEAFRVLRAGGRALVMYLRAEPTGPDASDASGTIHQLQAAGFRAARELAHRDGIVFFEAIKK